MQQVLTDLLVVLKITAADVEAARLSKKQKRGGFDQKIFLEKVVTND